MFVVWGGDGAVWGAGGGVGGEGGSGFWGVGWVSGLGVGCWGCGWMGGWVDGWMDGWRVRMGGGGLGGVGG